jgi:recombinational DNA repair ATPase RecF
MQIERITFRNFGSYGNKTMSLEIPADPSFFLIQGKNGHGKCLLATTKIQITATAEEIENFQEFLRLYRSKE